MIDVHCTSEFFDLVSPSGYSRWNFNGILAKHLDQRSSPTTFELTKTAGNFHRAPFAKTNNKRGLARSSVERITKHLLARQLLKEDPRVLSWHNCSSRKVFTEGGYLRLNVRRFQSGASGNESACTCNQRGMSSADESIRDSRSV